jgi:hypothetical protein
MFYQRLRLLQPHTGYYYIYYLYGLLKVVWLEKEGELTMM